MKRGVKNFDNLLLKGEFAPMKFLILSLFISFSWADEATLKKEIFEQTYFRQIIRDARCFENSRILLQEWQKAGIDISNAQIWYIENKGFNYFGLVKYYQNRWGGWYPSPQDPEYLTNTNGGWYYHAIVVSDGLVYDASYKQDPTVVSLLKYINDMFTLKHDITEPGKNYGWLKRSLGIKMIEKYKVTGYRGDKLLHAQQNKLALKDIALDFGTLSSHLTKGCNKNFKRKINDTDFRQSSRS
jgi:hypothetical protein